MNAPWATEKLLTLLIACALWLAASAAQAAGGIVGQDRIELTNGSILIGTFVDADEGKVEFRTDFAGLVKVDQSRIVSMDVSSRVTLQMSDGSLVETEHLRVDDRNLDLRRDGVSYALNDLMRINPQPWELGTGYLHSGVASTAFSLQRGNTVLDEFDYRVESRWRGLKDRYTLLLQGELREANNDATAENWSISGKYDRFQTGDYYWGVSGTAEENRFADLNLRTTTGPYLGRSLLENTPFVLEVETGLSYVTEDFDDNNDDQDYIGLTWNVRSESNYFGTDSRLYVDHRGVKNLDERSALIMNTTLGLGFPLLGRIQGSTEIVLDYNSGAVAGTEELDQTYRFRIGYRW